MSDADRSDAIGGPAGSGDRAAGIARQAPPDAADPAAPDLLADLVESVIRLVRQYQGLRLRIQDGQDLEAKPQMAVLGRLAELGPCRASVLAEALLSDPSTVSRQVAVLVKAGWVFRGPDPDDGRAAILELTAAGRERWDEHRHRRGRALAPVFERWPEQDQLDMVRLIRQYTDDIDLHWDEVVTAFRQPRPNARPGGS